MVGAPRLGAIRDPAQRHPVGVDAEPGEQRQSAGHQSLTAGLVDVSVAGLDQRDGESCETRLDRRREPDRATADDQHIDVGHVSSRSARFSVGMRKASSSTAFSTVNAIAVIHAVCTSGSAMPSTATTT